VDNQFRGEYPADAHHHARRHAAGAHRHVGMEGSCCSAEALRPLRHRRFPDGSPLVHSDDLKFEPAVSPAVSSWPITVQNRQQVHNLDVWNSRRKTPFCEPRDVNHGLRQMAISSFSRIRTSPAIRISGASIFATMKPKASPTPKKSTRRPITCLAADPLFLHRNHGDMMAIWTVPGMGGRRIPLNGSGYFPRYSMDGQSILSGANRHSGRWRQTATIRE